MNGGGEPPTITNSTPASTSTSMTDAKSVSTETLPRLSRLASDPLQADQGFDPLLRRQAQVFPEQRSIDVAFVGFDDWVAVGRLGELRVPCHFPAV
jgi:hypothetical protein